MEKTKTPTVRPLQKPVTSKPLVKPSPKVSKPPESEKPKESAAPEEKPATKPVKVPASSELASQLESINEKLDRLEVTVERLRRRTPSVFGRFFADLAKFMLLAALLTIAWQTGWVDRFLDWAAALDLGSLGLGKE